MNALQLKQCTITSHGVDPAPPLPPTGREGGVTTPIADGRAALVLAEGSSVGLGGVVLAGGFHAEGEVTSAPVGGGAWGGTWDTAVVISVAQECNL